MLAYMNITVLNDIPQEIIENNGFIREINFENKTVVKLAN